MSARTPRRRFSSSFVVTLAAAPACFVQSSTPPSQSVSQPDPGQPVASDPRPTRPPPEAQTPTYIANPPRPSGPPQTDPATPPPTQSEPNPDTLPADNPPAPDQQQWMISKANGKCQAQVLVHCPPKVMCNPPRPQAYACVEGITYPAKVTKSGGTCRVERDPPCPMNAKCKAPPIVPCP